MRFSGDGSKPNGWIVHGRGPDVKNNLRVFDKFAAKARAAPRKQTLEGGLLALTWD